MPRLTLARHLSCAVLLALVLLGGCQHTSVVLDQTLPERDIIYHVSTVYYEDKAPVKRIGFINADGGGQMYVTLTADGVAEVEEPVWTPTGDLVLFRSGYSRSLEGLTREGSWVEYRFDAWDMAPLSQPGRAVLNMANSSSNMMVALYDLEHGQVLRRYVLDEGLYESIGRNALSGPLLVTQRLWILEEDRKRLVCELVVRNVETRSERVLVHQEGPVHDNTMAIRNPAISPDGQWIVYTADDGLYLIRPDGSDQRRVLPLQMTRYGSLVGARWYQWPPAASWSPDSRSIVYSRCTAPGTRECALSTDGYAIYKLNIETLEEVLLVDGGANPYWRLGPQE